MVPRVGSLLHRKNVHALHHCVPDPSPAKRANSLIISNLQFHHSPRFPSPANWDLSIARAEASSSSPRSIFTSFSVFAFRLNWPCFWIEDQVGSFIFNRGTGQYYFNLMACIVDIELAQRQRLLRYRTHAGFNFAALFIYTLGRKFAVSWNYLKEFWNSWFQTLRTDSIGDFDLPRFRIFE